ncbi:50S ribosomal protein L19 [Candidatus Portiera aleyrodidarum]|uniref:Large ribosomal subunit protein bL19 n=1 Tax=Candidatus Portiera aleyrodidarum MED (Bemisia tabaci) TaxID=1163752 RepID=A0AAU8S7C6_9GAMM|nr:50S ribosomal protein L19 [Candidatus Portiera aleyrodidarum]AFQ24226.1 ribosomal protein L19 [Candidatus Portiera aleyrodidarum BT-B-HRs]AFS18981.1 50S ribosomal protein L19 [Candidatus Portiera aleyrodidarum BT-QVLC]AFT80641.1 LSU ribosomal protein L19p [Candidatus Portiera aleyrodidarum BT-QVLC]AFT80914.1 LSU ribosomal protein L19p [Candidatus Portiera aleyrodidarum BT-B-HRs]AJF24204.1 50S ribosomal protein L19 [Candidatus Portiera aleyrodidarum MED (Bemisia tabaci)]
MSINQLIQAIELEQMKTKIIPKFMTGDTVIVQIKVLEGSIERLQAFEGLVIGKRNRGLNSSFTVRKVTSGIGIERTFKTYSTCIFSIKINRKGKVRKSKLYYLRDLKGKSARINNIS